ncbi:MAG TPA: efflux RND transporter periplasmic adaptor subunit [Fibrobacteria bacterium]|nr:efflux RND transporter periplasmic adaptor subunit [Fibrobacteria bacterium]
MKGLKRKTAWLVLAAAAIGAALGAGAFRLLGQRQAEAAPAPAAKTMYTCAMHPNYISEKPGHCPFCGMELVPMGNGSEGGKGTGASGAPGARGVRIDAATLRNMGVRTEPVAKRTLAPAVRTSGKIAVDEKRQFSVNARVAGFVESLRAATTGQAVRRGETLLELYSPELASTQEEYLQALRYAKGLQAKGGGPAAAAAAELVESSRRRLLNWDVPEAEIRALEERGSARKTLPVVSPASGVVLEKLVLQGQNVTPGMPLYRIADLSRVWVVANVYQGDLARIQAGSRAEITLSYLPGKTFRGRVAFVSPVLDPATRTAEVRIETGNTPALDLKPEMFATVVMQAPRAAPVVAVPEQAIIRSGRRDIAVVAAGGGRFEPREVKLGAAADGYVEVLEGLAEGESLVVSSQFLIDSESNLKAAIEQMQARQDRAGADDAGKAP